MALCLRACGIIAAHDDDELAGCSDKRIMGAGPGWNAGGLELLGLLRQDTWPPIAPSVERPQIYPTLFLGRRHLLCGCGRQR